MALLDKQAQATGLQGGRYTQRLHSRDARHAAFSAD